MHDIAVAFVAPKGEVSEGEADRMVLVGAVVGNHVTLDISTASHGLAPRLQTEPIFAGMPTVRASVLDMDAFKGLLGGYILRGAMWTVFLWLDCVESLNLHLDSFLVFG